MTCITKLLPITAILVTSQLAAAEPTTEDPPPPPAAAASSPRQDRAFVGGGLMLGIDHFLNGAWLLDGGVKLGALPVWIHGTAGTGGAIDADSGGDFWRVTAGLETRTCTVHGQCAFAGIEAGYQRQTWVSEPDNSDLEHHQGPIVGPRVGLDAGGDRIRFRAALELYQYRREQVETGMTGWQSGGGFTLGVAYRI